MYKRIVLVLLLVSSLILSGCFTHNYIMGEGPKTGVVDEQRQWFVLWGLVPINTVDTKGMIGDAKNYSVRSEFTPLDIVIGIFTGIISVQPRTVEVRK